MDRGTIQDVASAFAAEFGISITSIREGTDPPDVIATANGRDVSIELVEFLNEAMRIKEAQKRPVVFEEKLWTGAAVLEKLNAVLDKKDAIYDRRDDGFAADILLIHSCELWLNAGDVEKWLVNEEFEPRRTIRSAYFALERLPDYPKPHWPLFKLYG
ncbi:MAG: hypothetical protein WDN76_05050 [Alphaproteobacteria bacterium]